MSGAHGADWHYGGHAPHPSLARPCLPAPSNSRLCSYSPRAWAHGKLGVSVSAGSHVILMRLVCDLCLQYKPSLIAAAAVAAARIQLQVTPIWPTSLQSLTGYRPEAVAGCSWLLSNNFSIEKRCSAHDCSCEAVPATSPKAGNFEENNVSPTNVELGNYFR